MAFALPTQFRKLVATALGTNFREVTRIVSVPLAAPRGAEVLVRNVYAGVNASDINFTNGVYLPGVAPPFDTGFESIGEVVATGPEVSQLKPGDAVAVMHFGAFAEYITLPAKRVIPVPSLQARFLPALVSGLTASLGAPPRAHGRCRDRRARRIGDDVGLRVTAGRSAGARGRAPLRRDRAGDGGSGRNGPVRGAAGQARGQPRCRNLQQR